MGIPLQADDGDLESVPLAKRLCEAASSVAEAWIFKREASFAVLFV
jgi:hypothetical protein